MNQSDNDYSSEQQSVAMLFRKHFSKTRSVPLLLYGTGRNSEAILSLCPEIPVAGIMGPDVGGVEWGGKPVVSPEQAAEMGADIVIVARDSVVSIIYRRIQNLEERGVHIYRVNGMLVGKHQQYENGDLPYWKASAEALRGKIDSVCFVSFDIFDTLLTRCVLRPEDIFQIVAHRLPWKTERFSLERQNAEKELGPTAGIREIYQCLAGKLHYSDEQINTAISMEWQVECDMVVPRQAMIGMLFYALQLRKTVWLLSDMYWSSNCLRELLKRCGMEFDVPILVSCETGYTKENGSLYLEYLKCIRAAPCDCLHIGDNRYADIQESERIGLNSFQLYSGYRMLEESAAQGLLHFEGKGSSALGRFVSDCFSSPFALNGFRGRIPIRNAYLLGKIFLAPLIDYWLDWLVNSINGSSIRRMLFPARDGFLLHQLYERIRINRPELPPGVYFKASRRALTVASIRTEADVKKIADRVFHGSVCDFFLQRYGIAVTGDEPWDTGSNTAEELLSHHMPEILKNAAMERERYLQYLRELGLPGDGCSGFFDFAAGGTVQHHYQRLVGGTVQGFYFATMNLPNDFYGIGEISTPFGNIISYGGSPFATGYLMMESVLTDPDPTFLCIGEAGEPKYAERSFDSWPVMSEIQRGIVESVLARINRGDPSPDRETALGIWQLLFDGSCVVDPDLRANFQYEDAYDGAAAEPSWIPVDKE